MAFGGGEKKIGGNSNLKAFEELAKKNYGTDSSSKDSIGSGKESNNAVKKPVSKKENGSAGSEDKSLNNVKKESVDIVDKEPKKPVKKTNPEKKLVKEYYKQFYNLRVDLPKESEEYIELAAKYYGSRKEYISKLIMEDLKKNLDEYRKGAKKEEDKWSF